MRLSHIHETAWSQGEDSPKPESHDKDKNKMSAYRIVAADMGITIGSFVLNRETGVARATIIRENHQIAKPSFRTITETLERKLTHIDVDQIIPKHAKLINVPSQHILVRESTIYLDTIEQYRQELKDTGQFVNPSGYPEDTYFPWGIKINNNVIIMDGTHRAEAEYQEGNPTIRIHIFQSEDFGINFDT
jgi:hypothetical protein